MISKNEKNWPCLTVLIVVKAQIHEMKKKNQHFNLTFLSPRKQIVPCKGLEKGVNFIKAFLGSQTQKVEWRLLIVIARNLIDVKVLDV